MLQWQQQYVKTHIILPVILWRYNGGQVEVRLWFLALLHPASSIASITPPGEEIIWDFCLILKPRQNPTEKSEKTTF